MRSTLALAFLASAFSLHAGIIASSAFNADAEGWSGLSADPTTAPYSVALTPGVTHQAAGGNPNGHITLADPDGNDTFFVAPASYRGNLLAAIGGLLTYDLLYNNTTDYDGNDLVIKGGGLVLTYNRAIPTLPANTWTSLSITLAPGAGWTLHPSGTAATLADFQTVFANITDFWIMAEFTNGIVETTGLDNVALATADIPESGTSLFLVTGLAAMALGRFRRQ